MSSTRLPRVLGFISIAFLAVFLWSSSQHVYSVAGHVVISEIQIGGTTANDEFVELYNPTDNPISLTNWRLSKKTAGGTESDIIASTMSGTIASHGYFLIAHANDYDGASDPDTMYSGSTTVAPNNTVLLYDGTGALMDKVGMGTATDKETSTASVPGDNKSIERKAQETSTVESMTTGADVTAGNGEDTDNNLNDFILRAASDPQNSVSAIEPVIVPTSTATPTSTPTVTTSPSPTPTIIISPTETPTQTPTETPTPTSTLTNTPTNTPSPTVSSTPSTTPTPTVTVTLSSTPTNTPTPTVTFTPTPTPTVTSPPPLGTLSVECAVTYRTIKTRWITISLPRIRCQIVRS